MMALLMDIAAPGGGAIFAGAGILLFIALAAVAFIAFRIFRKTMKMAFRLALLAAILFVAVVGSVGVWLLGPANNGPRPVPQRTR